MPALFRGGESDVRGLRDEGNVRPAAPDRRDAAVGRRVVDNDDVVWR